MSRKEASMNNPDFSDLSTEEWPELGPPENEGQLAIDDPNSFVVDEVYGNLSSTSGRMAHVVENEEHISDVVFYVGRDKTPVKSSKFLLCLLSTHFQELFSKRMENDISDEEEPVLEVPKEEEPALVVPKEEEPALVVPKEEEPALVVPNEEEPALEVPNKEEPALEVPNKEEPELVVPKEEGIESSSSDQSSVKIEYPEFEPSAFKQVIHFLHRSEAHDFKDRDLAYILDVFQIATRLQFNDLIKQCEETMGPFADTKGACDFLNTVLSNPGSEEKDLLNCRVYIYRYAEQIIKSESFLDLSEPTIVEMLKTDLGTVDEVDVFDAVLKWAKNKNQMCPTGEVTADDGIKLRKTLENIVLEIRFSNMTANQIVDLDKSAKVFNSSEVVDLILFIRGAKTECHPFKTHPRRQLSG